MATTRNLNLGSGGKMFAKLCTGLLLMALVIGGESLAAKKKAASSNETKLCSFKVTSSYGLVRGASEQTLNIQPGAAIDAAETLRTLGFRPNMAFAVAAEFSTEADKCTADGSYTLRDAVNAALTVPFSMKGGGTQFLFGAIPPDLPVGSHLWFVDSVTADSNATRTPIGVVELQVVGFPTPDRLAVAYQDPELDRLQSGIAAKGPHDRPEVAVVNLLWQAKEAASIADDKHTAKRKVLNTSGFASLQGLPVGPGTDGLKWVMTERTWGERVWFEGCATTPCDLKSLAKLSFAVRERIPGPLIVWLSLKQKQPNGTYLSLFKVPVELASEARVESLPFSINRRIRILCGENVDEPSVLVRPSATKAVDDQDLFLGRCRARICYCNPCAESGNDAVFCTNGSATSSCSSTREAAVVELDRERSILLGPQTLEVRVHRDGASEDAVQRWNIDPAGTLESSNEARHDDFSLPVPDQGVNAEGDGLYRVEIRVDATAPEAVYREGASLQGRNINIAASLPDRQFSAYLRRRGPFGFPARKPAHKCPNSKITCDENQKIYKEQNGNVRMFATIPVQALGIRVPANLRNIRNSGDPTRYELVTLRTGVAVVVEPWNYDRYKNLSPVPIRFSAGFNFFSFTNRSFGIDPTFVVSARVTFPLVQSDTRVASQLGSSVTLGPSWEVDLRTGRSYLLVNLGIDLLTLFSTQ